MLVLVPLAIALVFSACWIGGILLVIAQAARRNVPPPRRRLWARILLRIGGLLCVSIPAAFYGVLPAGLKCRGLCGQTPILPSRSPRSIRNCC
jgi:hypothetical protein